MIPPLLILDEDTLSVLTNKIEVKSMPGFQDYAKKGNTWLSFLFSVSTQLCLTDISDSLKFFLHSGSLSAADMEKNLLLI